MIESKLVLLLLELLVLPFQGLSQISYARHCLIPYHPTDTYCTHRCKVRSSVDVPNAYCDAASGNCVCSSTCENGIETVPVKLDETVCPAKNNPPDPQRGRNERCRESCKNICPNGVIGKGTVCSGHPKFLQPNVLASICICQCSGCPKTEEEVAAVEPDPELITPAPLPDPVPATIGNIELPTPVEVVDEVMQMVASVSSQAMEIVDAVSTQVETVTTAIIQQMQPPPVATIMAMNRIFLVKPLIFIKIFALTKMFLLLIPLMTLCAPLLLLFICFFI